MISYSLCSKWLWISLLLLQLLALLKIIFNQVASGLSYKYKKNKSYFILTKSCDNQKDIKIHLKAI